MPVSIHGKQYYTVAERLAEARKDIKSITTEVLAHTPRVVVKATVTVESGVYTGISGANIDKTIEKSSPYEVAETSAVGRALAFAGYKMTDSIASAEEMEKIPDADWIKGDDKPKTPSEAFGICEDCGEQKILGRNGKPYCKACYIKWAEANKK